MQVPEASRDGAREGEMKRKLGEMKRDSEEAFEERLRLAAEAADIVASSPLEWFVATDEDREAIAEGISAARPAKEEEEDGSRC